MVACATNPDIGLARADKGPDDEHIECSTSSRMLRGSLMRGRCLVCRLDSDEGPETSSSIADPIQCRGPCGIMIPLR